MGRGSLRNEEELIKQHKVVSESFANLLSNENSVFLADTNAIVILIEMDDFKLLDRLREFKGFYISDIAEAELRKWLRPLSDSVLAKQLTLQKNRQLKKLQEFLMRMNRRGHIVSKRPTRKFLTYMDGLMKFVPRNFVYDILISEYNKKSMLSILYELCRDYEHSFESAKSTKDQFKNLHEWFERQTSSLKKKLIGAWMKRFERHVRSFNHQFSWPKEFNHNKLAAILWKIAKPLYAQMLDIVSVEGRGKEDVFNRLFSKAKKSFKADVDIVSQAVSAKSQLVTLDSDTQWLPVLHRLAMNKV